MEGYQADGAPRAGNLAVTPDIPEIHVPHAEAPWPDRTEALEHRLQDLLCRHTAGARVSTEMVKQMPQPWTLRAKILRRARHSSPEGPQQGRAPSQAHERIVRRDLESVGQGCLREALQASGIGLPWIICPTRKHALQEGVETCDGETF